MDEVNGAEPPGGDDGPDDDRPVSTLRRAGVQIGAARAARVVGVVGLAILLVVGGVLLVAGIRKNSQIDSLRSDPVPVRSSVVHCLALMGGTGSSPAGFECVGAYTYHGTRYVEGIPGSVLLQPGTAVHGIISAGDPGLFSTSQTVAGEHSSPVRVVLPAVFLAVTLGVAVWLVLRSRRRSARA